MPDTQVLKGLKLSEFVAIDVETTGFSPKTDKIIEIAAVKYIDGVATDKFSKLVNPEMELSVEITAVTGITQKDLEDKPRIEEVLPEFLEFIGDSPLIGHNIRFDLDFIHTAIFTNGLSGNYKASKYHDTLILSQIFYPKGPANHKLSTLSNYLGLNSDGFHRALSDSISCGELFLLIVDEAIKLSERTVRKLAQFSSEFDTLAAEFLANLSNFYVKTSISRPMEGAEKQYINSDNVIYREANPSFESIQGIASESAVDKVFAKEGLLGNFRKFEYREEQHLMAKKSYEVLSQGKFLVCEAGTGIGKSYAYLVPSIMHGLLSEEKIVISTNTKNLQEQIFFKDLPVLHQLFGGAFKGIILKGRKNYLCKKRYDSILARPKGYFSSKADAEKFLPLIVWAEKTVTGDIEENSGFKMKAAYSIWNMVQSDTGYCKGKKCRQYKHCFLQKVRRDSKDAQVVVINHSLLFSDIVSENGVLGKYENVVLDEAHNIENAATSYMGAEFSMFPVRLLSHRLNPKDGRGGQIRRLVNMLSGAEVDLQDKGYIEDILEQLKDKLDVTNEFGAKLFGEIGQFLFDKEGNDSIPTVKKRFRDSEEVFDGFHEDKERFKQFFEEVITLLRRLNTLLDTLDEDVKDALEDITGEFESYYLQFQSLYDSYLFFNDTKRENFVFWYEIQKKENMVLLNLNAAPLNVSEILQEKFYNRLSSCILTSATLTIEKRFKYMLRKLGLENMPSDRIETLMLGSPFDLKNQLKVVTPSYCASPKNVRLHKNDVIDVVNMMATDFDYGTLVLFTSYGMMYQIKNEVSDTFKRTNKLLMVQGHDGSRTDMINEFRSIRNSFLFGTDSFWEGVDVPGKALEMLIIPKLPFQVPTEPVVEARIEQLERSGQNSFMGYSVPEAILKFKQGVGRLIRTHTDTGMVFILDSRVINTRYGKAFINSLPVDPIIARNLREVRKVTEDFDKIREKI